MTSGTVATSISKMNIHNDKIDVVSKVEKDVVYHRPVIPPRKRPNPTGMMEDHDHTTTTEAAAAAATDTNVVVVNDASSSIVTTTIVVVITTQMFIPSRLPSQRWWSRTNGRTSRRVTHTRRPTRILLPILLPFLPQQRQRRYHHHPFIRRAVWMTVLVALLFFFVTPMHATTTRHHMNEPLSSSSYTRIANLIQGGRSSSSSSGAIISTSTAMDHIDDDDDDDDTVTTNEKERELYSYDDTYYSDIHFYSNDDDYTTSSSSSNSYYSKTTSTTKVLPSNIDWTSYALKYVSCANIKTWRSTTDSSSSSNRNQNDDSTTTESDVLVQRTLVVVRLCPATLCSTYNVKGCNKDYGEYVLPASDYLQIIHTYYINQASMEKYCSVCSACMAYVTNPPTTSPTASPTVTTNNGDDYYNRRRRHLANTDDYFNDDAYGSSSYGKYKPWYLDDTYQCMYQNVCHNYMNKCKKYIENNNDDVSGTSTSTATTSATTATMTNTTFGQCIAFRGDGSNSNTDYSYYYYYAAPHCAADGRTLHVGLYADPNCTIYVKSTGSSNPFAIYTSGLSCLSCNYYDSSESSYALIPDTAIIKSSSSSSNTDDTSSSSALSTNHPLCSNLYNTSAHCNTKLTPFTSNNNNNNSTMTLSNYTAGEDNVVCPYIASLEDNMYDAYGDVILLKSSMYGLFSPFWRKGNGVEDESQSTSTNAPKHRTVELGILFLSMCVFCSLSIQAYTLRQKLLSRKFISWTTTTTAQSSSSLHDPIVTNTNESTLFPWLWNGGGGGGTRKALTIDRTDSGIAMTRTGSSPSYEAPQYSLGSYDSDNFIIPTTTKTQRPVYQPYGGTIPSRPTSTGMPCSGTTTTAANTLTLPPQLRPPISTSSSVVRFQKNQDDTIENIPSLEYMDRNTGRLA